MQLPFGTERVDDAIDHYRNRTWSFVEAEVVAIGCWIPVLPLRFSGGRVERLDHFAVAHPVEQDQTVAHDDGSAQALANFPRPGDLRSARWKGADDGRAAIGPIPIGPEELRPVGGQVKVSGDSQGSHSHDRSRQHAREDSKISKGAVRLIQPST
jgi:hypothetical protein